MNDIHGLTSKAIDELNLVDYARDAAERLLKQFPAVIFTSGRRTVAQQAEAMAGNVFVNHNWIRQTYKASAESASLQAWVDVQQAVPPPFPSSDYIANGLRDIMKPWTDAQKKTLSRHFSGQAFDIHPVAGAQGTAIKAAIRKLPHLRTFLESS